MRRALVDEEGKWLQIYLTLLLAQGNERGAHQLERIL